MEVINLWNSIFSKVSTTSEFESIQNYHGSPKVYPLVNHTALIHLTPDDLIRPGEYGWMISTLPMFQLLLNISAFIIWWIVLLYFWKLIYYQVDDPYATPGGSSPGNFQKRMDVHSRSLLQRVYDAFELFSED